MAEVSRVSADTDKYTAVMPISLASNSPINPAAGRYLTLMVEAEGY